MSAKKLFRRKTLQDIMSHQQQEGEVNISGLNRTLTVRDLTAFGIAAIVGAGIFSTIGNAAASGGPAISLLFIFTGVACGFSALCYAEFASTVPVSGSAYTYAYYSFGELIAWIIGWDLLLEYAIGNIAVAISWSDYFTSFARGMGWQIPPFLTVDYLSAFKAHDTAQQFMSQGKSLAELPVTTQEGYLAWQHAPIIGSIRLIADIPALVIVTIITTVVYIGIKESRTVNNVMVGIKLLVVLAVIAIGAFYVHPANWSPFAPRGIAGVLGGISAVFFAYIGFDAISTTAEECKNPERDLPRSIFYALIICTVLYVAIALVLTGMVRYSTLAVGDPLAFVFKQIGLDWVSGIVAFTALIAMASVLLIFQLGQPRIWMSMSRDGLLPKRFSHIHPKFKTPSFSTIVTGIIVAVPALFLNLKEVTDLTSIGTLFAFIVVCGGLLIVKEDPSMPSGRFKVPYVNGKYIIPVLMLLVILLDYYFDKTFWSRLVDHDTSTSFFAWDAFREKVPLLLFVLVSMCITALTYVKNLSTIPVLGLLTCLFLMTELGYTNWLRFLIWLIIGLGIYFSYGRKHSHLNALSGNSPQKNMRS